jgi:hypothetical protein
MLQNTVQYANKYKNLLFQLVYCREYLFYEKFDTCMCALVSIVQNQFSISLSVSYQHVNSIFIYFGHAFRSYSDEVVCL